MESMRRMTRGGRMPIPRMLSLRRIVFPKGEETIDEAMVVVFKGPNSYTGEDLVEYHVHGGVGVIRDVLRCLGEMGTDFVMAGPGDFTRRAWMNGKIRDLTRLEAIADLIHSETSFQRRQAMEQMFGGMEGICNGWSERIYQSLAHLEAIIDFGEDELLIEKSDQIWLSQVKSMEMVLDELRTYVNDKNRGQILRTGINVCLLGRPNAGKSSIMNALSRTQTSIISPEAGTTRDIVEAHLDFNGYPIILQDTAGINKNPHNSIGSIEKEGIRRALNKFTAAQVKVIIADFGDPDLEKDHELTQFINTDHFHTILVLNKVDLVKDPNCFPTWIQTLSSTTPISLVTVSCLTNIGLDKLTQMITSKVQNFLEFNSTFGPPITRERHRSHLVQCIHLLEKFMTRHSNDLELAADDLKSALRSISRITGKIDVEHILDIVFREFCIGK